ncbi:SDR family NAD(P)-dependent oxidoreductase [Actinospongicola halichondriae]|uniref:SDR family NAD(P)-dependent oxidoreductase n=1 Tax=Actinospongicola halichondriae TaxID=3236844 RepID=UPI003D3B7B4D
MELRGKTVVVTGASQGIGAALARAFAAAGSTVVLAARSVDKLEALAAETGGLAHPVDLLDPEQTDRFIADVEAAHGPIDVLVNNAGLDSSRPAAAIEIQTIRRVTRLNVEAPMVLTRQVLPGMLERRSGHLVYLSSLAGTASFPTMSHYAATKAGIMNFAGSVRWEVRKHGVGVTIVAPGPVDTEMWDRYEDMTGTPGNVRRRFERLQLLPKLAPDVLADRTVAAVRDGKRHVRHPRRLSTNFWLNEAPRRIVEAALTGVRFDPTGRE